MLPTLLVFDEIGHAIKQKGYDSALDFRTLAHFGLIAPKALEVAEAKFEGTWKTCSPHILDIIKPLKPNDRHYEGLSVGVKELCLLEEEIHSIKSDFPDSKALKGAPISFKKLIDVHAAMKELCLTEEEKLQVLSPYVRKRISDMQKCGWIPENKR
jgi:hypothetical protein